ncbi:MAG: LysM peptidoglycan-binding domain-containing protein [Gammaproteobacteria bacterium]
MSTPSSPLYRSLLVGALALTLVTGCSTVRNIDLNPFSQDTAPVLEEAPSLVPTAASQVRPGESFPVRQPPVSNRELATGPDTSYVGQSGRTGLKLRPDAPQNYTVVKGDTLWDISGLFLQNPWHWPEIWQVNPQIANPHLIYPGDVLSLVWVNGQPRIMINQRSTDMRLSPQVRVLPLDAAIRTIPYDAIEPFLAKPRVMSTQELAGLPYVLEMKESHIIAGSGFTVYTRNNPDAEVGDRYNVMHVGDPVYDPDSRQILGYQTHHVGGGRVTQQGDPAKLFLNETSREVLRGDKLVSQDITTAQDFVPSPPKYIVDGTIIDVIEGVKLIGQYQIVVINRGTKHGLEAGNVLSIFQRGDVIRDRFAERSLFSRTFFAPRVKLPDEQAGIMMVFRVQDGISYGIVMQATSELYVGDKVVNPE